MILPLHPRNLDAEEGSISLQSGQNPILESPHTSCSLLLTNAFDPVVGVQVLCSGQIAALGRLVLVTDTTHGPLSRVSLLSPKMPSSPAWSLSSSKGTNRCILSLLPEEVLSSILWSALAEPWPFSFHVHRAETLLVCHTFHRLGREALYESVLLVNTTSFHNFFCVDDEEWEAVNGLSPVKHNNPEDKAVKWRDMEEAVLKRREADWRQVRQPLVSQCTRSWADSETGQAPHPRPELLSCYWNAF